MAWLPGDEGTTHWKENYEPLTDAQRLKELLIQANNLDCDRILNLLMLRDHDQRVMICDRFNLVFNEGSNYWIDNAELPYYCKELVKDMLQHRDMLDAKSLIAAVKGPGTDEATLVEILGTRSYERRKAIVERAKSSLKSDLVYLIRDDTSGPFRELLTALLTDRRTPEDEETIETSEGITADAKLLKENGIAETFDKIFATRTYSHMRSVFQVYELITYLSIEDAVKQQTTGQYLQYLLVIIGMIKDKNNYFASRLKYCMRGAGTDDPGLIRIIVSRCDKDIVQIREAYDRKYDSIVADIESDERADPFRYWLIKMVGGH